MSEGYHLEYMLSVERFILYFEGLSITIFSERIKCKSYFKPLDKNYGNTKNTTDRPKSFFDKICNHKLAAKAT